MFSARVIPESTLIPDDANVTTTGLILLSVCSINFIVSSPGYPPSSAA
jgi:hypothetical protein